MSTTDTGTSPDRMNAMMGSAAMFAEPQAASEPQGGSFGQSSADDSQSTGQQANADNMQNIPGGTLDPRPTQPANSGAGQAAAQPGSGASPAADGGQASPPPEAAGPSTDTPAPGASADGGSTAGGATDTPPADASASAGAGGQGSTTANVDGSASAGNSGSSADGGASSSITDPVGVSGLVDNLLSPLGGAVPLHLAGQGAVTQPVLDVANSVVLNVHNVLESLSDQTGTAHIVHGITDLGETIGLGQLGAEPGAGGNSNLLTDVLNLPGDALNGDLGSSIDHIGADLSNVIDATAGLGDAVLNGSDPLNPIPELIHSVGSDLQSNPLLTLGGTDGDGSSGLLSGVVGDLSHSSSGHLVDVGVDGVGTPLGNGLALDLLSTPDGASSPIDVSAIDVGPTGPQLIDLTLNGDSIGGSQGGVTDGLGNVLNLDGVGQDLTNGALLSLNGGNNGSGLLGGDALNLNGSSTGHLADANVDGTGTSPLVVDALAEHGSGPQSPVDVNAVDVGPNGPQVADVGVNTDAPALSLAPLAGGSDGLVGSITQVTGIASTDGAPLSDLGSVEDVASIAPIGGDHGLLHLNGAQII
ncbi:hypothetical protein [Rhodopseudomonas palustris]|nr:hypothetical protein [Rhodopseudomonas palustris]